MEFNGSLGSIGSLVKIDTTIAPKFSNITNILSIVGNGSMVIPKGTTIERPTQESGMVRYNTDEHLIEFSNGTIWSGINNPTFVYTSSTIVPDQIVDTVSVSKYRTVKYIIQVTSDTEYQTSELLIIHDGSTPSITEYATILTGDILASFNASIVTDDLNLLVTPTNANTTIKVIRMAITI